MGTYPVATTVQMAHDGGQTHGGSWMAETNWGSSTDPYSSFNKKGWPWTSEMFLRFWFRYDTDVDNSVGSKMFRLGGDYPAASMFLACQMERPPSSPLYYNWDVINGASNVFLSWGDSTGCGDHVWHKLEIYIKANTSGQANGILRMWKDGVIYQDNTNVVSVTPGHFWNEIGFVSNWSISTVNNHVYWDDFEIYTDSTSGTAATGNLSNASIQATGTPPPPDTTPPTVSLTAPSAGSTVSGSSVTVSTNASDNIGVSGVQFLLDGTNLGAEDTTSPYSVTWNTTTATNGSHTLTARARDAAGNTTTSSSVTITVDNGPLVGDLNQDRTVNGADWTIMAGVWFTADAVADINKDGIVNSIDFSLMNANWGRTI